MKAPRSRMLARLYQVRLGAHGEHARLYQVWLGAQGEHARLYQVRLGAQGQGCHHLLEDHLQEHEGQGEGCADIRIQPIC